MKRFLTICCSLALACPTSIALCAPPTSTTGQALLAKRGLADFDLDGNGTLDASERAAALTARNAERHQTASASGATSNSGSSAPATTSKTKGQGGANRYVNNGTNAYASSGGYNIGSLLVVNPQPSQCPIQNEMRNYFATTHPISGGSVVAPIQIESPGANGQNVFVSGAGTRIITPSNLPQPAVVSWPQLPNPNTGAQVYWMPASSANLQPGQAINAAMAHGARHGR